MLSVISLIAGMCAHTPVGVLLHVLDLGTAETQEAVAVFTDVLRIQLREILIEKVSRDQVPLFSPCTFCLFLYKHVSDPKQMALAIHVCPVLFPCILNM